MHWVHTTPNKIPYTGVYRMYQSDQTLISILIIWTEKKSTQSNYPLPSNYSLPYLLHIASLGRSIPTSGSGKRNFTWDPDRADFCPIALRPYLLE